MSDATQAAPAAAQDVPERVTVSRGGLALQLTDAGGATRSLKSARLRMACRCAQCVRARIDGTLALARDEVTILAVDPMGHYGISIAFSDGHARGIYPWSYLAELLKE